MIRPPGYHPRRRSAATGGVIAVALVPIVLGSIASGAWASTKQDEVIEGCRIVLHPTLRRHTTCPRSELAAADLRDTDLAYADLSGTDLSYADLSGADLSGATLARANFSGAILSGANLSGDYLSGLDLVGAAMTSAQLVDANLVGQNLSGFNLTGADLAGANLTDATLTNVTWSHTRCPDGSKSNVVGGTCVNDLLVLQGLAIGSASTGPLFPSVGTGPPSTPGDSSSTRSQLGELPFTGAPTSILAAIGFALVIAGLLLIRRSKAALRA